MILVHIAQLINIYVERCRLVFVGDGQGLLLRDIAGIVTGHLDIGHIDCTGGVVHIGGGHNHAIQRKRIAFHILNRCRGGDSNGFYFLLHRRNLFVFYRDGQLLFCGSHDILKLVKIGFVAFGLGHQTGALGQISSQFNGIANFYIFAHGKVESEILATLGIDVIRDRSGHDGIDFQVDFGQHRRFFSGGTGLVRRFEVPAEIAALFRSDGGQLSVIVLHREVQHIPAFGRDVGRVHREGDGAAGGYGGVADSKVDGSSRGFFGVFFRQDRRTQRDRRNNSKAADSGKPFGQTCFHLTFLLFYRIHKGLSLLYTCFE